MNLIGKKINNKNGVVLALIVIVFAVIAILTTSVVAIVYSDAKFSVNDENSSKAYYAARSAVATVEQGINIELKKLNDLKAILLTAGNTFNSNKTEENLNAYMTAKLAYEFQHVKISGYVLPETGPRTYSVQIDGLGAESNHTTVSAVQHSPGFTLTASATVNGLTRTVSKYIGSNISTPSEWNIDPHKLFENSLYAVNGINVGNNGDIYSEILGSGDVSYYTTPAPIFTMHNGAEIVGRPEAGTLDSAGSLISSYTAGLTTASAPALFTNGMAISKNARYSGAVNWKGDYVVTTGSSTASSIVLRFDNVNLDDDFSFKVKGNGALIIYVTGVFSKSQANAQLKMIFQPYDLQNGLNDLVYDDSEIYLMIDGPTTGTDNIFDDKNNLKANNFTIYAPATDLNFKNNFGGQGPSGILEGSIYGKNINLKNNSSIKYVKPRLFNNIMGGSGGSTSATAITTYSISEPGGFWLKD